jgi:tRNA threonylcarbamoyladenosine biosynthesis protein TsaB
MWTLGLETSTRNGSVAISDGDDILRSRSLGGQAQKHATVLFQELQALLSDVGIAPRRIGRIGVSIGPGSFTGLRIGVVAAKTIAWALECELKAIDSFLAVALAAPEAVTDLIVVGDAQRGDLFVGRYHRHENGLWCPQGNIEIVPANQFLSSLSGDETISGPGTSRYLPQLQETARVLDKSLRTPQAQAICRLAEREDIPASDCWSLKPLYFRESSAEEKWEKAHSSQS